MDFLIKWLDLIITSGVDAFKKIPEWIGTGFKFATYYITKFPIIAIGFASLALVGYFDIFKTNHKINKNLNSTVKRG